MPNYYTLQIHYGGTEKPKVEERKDLNCGTMAENEWLRTLREKLFTTGFHVVTAPGTIEFISPWHIHTAFLIKQDKKFGI